MKTVHRLLSYALFSAFLSACTTRADRQALESSRAQSQKLGQQLRIGATKESIRSEGGEEPSNCQGSSQTIEVCELRYRIGTNAPYRQLIESDYSRYEYEIYTLTFEKGLLKRWDKRTEFIYHGEEQPRH